MIDAFLIYFLVSLIPIAFIGIGGAGEHALFATWRIVQVVTLVAASAYVLVQLARRDWRELVVLVLLGVVVAYTALSYSGVAWDAQIEYNRVILLAERYGSLTEAYRHGMASWILGYPPGTSLSAQFHRTLHLASPNVAQGLLFLLWSGAFMVRHMRGVDLAGKLAFFFLLITGAQFYWHLTFFYNNLFYALIWAELVLVPLLGSSLRPFELCAYALVLVWLRPQWQIAAIPIGTGALATMLATPGFDRRALRDLALVTIAALIVSYLAAMYWQTAAVTLGRALADGKKQVVDAIGERPHPNLLHVDVVTRAYSQQAPPPTALWSKKSLEAIDWALVVTRGRYEVTLWTLGLLALLSPAMLRRRGVAFIVPLLSPIGIVVGTAFFARSYAQYRDNLWALERLQIITPILAAGTVVALYRTLREQRAP